MIPRNSLLIIVVLILCAIVFSAVWYDRLPEVVPTHWNASGQADDYGSRSELVILTPLIMILVTLLLHVLPRLGPFRKNIESFRPTLGRIAVVAVAAGLAIHIITLLAAEGRDMSMRRSIPIVVGVLLATLGNWFGKLRRNFYIGVRTPWTIANDEVWERTHRLGGRLFVVYGVLLVITALAIPGRGATIMVGGILIIALWLTIYSVIVYRRVGQADQIE